MAELKQLARQIFQETLAAIDIPEAMRRKLQRKSTRVRCGEMTVDLAAYRTIHVMAIGKAALAMIEGLASVLAPDFSASGIVAAPTEPQRPRAGMRYFRAGHPDAAALRSEEHTSELQSRQYLVCRLLLEKKKTLRALEAVA